MFKQFLTMAAIGLGMVLAPVQAVSFADDDLPPSDLTDEEKIYGLSHFWKEVSYNFAHWESTGEIDWDAEYQKALPRVLATENTFEYYRELQRFCALLKDGHTNVWMPDGLFRKHRDRIPLILTEVEQRAIVRNMPQELAEEIPVGTEILAIDGKSVEDMIRQDIMPYISTSTPHMYWDQSILSFSSVGAGILFGPIGSTAELKLQKPSGEVVTLSLPRDHYQRKVTWAVKSEKQQLFEFRMLEGDIAYVALNDFSKDEIVDEFRAKLPALAKAKAIIVDLRKNGGGNSYNSSAIVGHFTDEPFTGSTWRTVIHDAVYKAWGKAADSYPSLEKYRDYYEGHVYREVEPKVHQPSEGQKLTQPTIVLIGKRTASAAEDFLIMADGIPHISTMGTPTHGSTGQPLALDLPGGGRARISAKRDFYPDGREFIGIGVVPDVHIAPTVEDLRIGQDGALEAARKRLLK